MDMDTYNFMVIVIHVFYIFYCDLKRRFGMNTGKLDKGGGGG